MVLLLMSKNSNVIIKDGLCTKNLAGNHSYFVSQTRGGKPILGSKCCYCGDMHPGYNWLGQEKARDAGIGFAYARFCAMYDPERLPQETFKRAYKKHMDSLNLLYVTADVNFAWEHYKDNPHKYLFVLPFVGELI